MKYENPQLRDKLAAEYVLGTLRGRARMRFQQLLERDVALRHAVTAWEARLTPLASAIPAVTPPARVWRAITARIAGGARRGSFWTSLGWWRGIGIASTALLLVFAGYIASTPPSEPPISMLAVLSDQQARPAIVVSWPPQKSERNRYLRVKAQAHPEMPAHTSWELWMLPGGKQPPVSLGLMSADLTQTIPLNESASEMIGKVWGLAVSVEPKGGSPTGQPTGPVIFSGQCVKII